MSLKDNISELQEKFWQGETTLEEEKWLKEQQSEGQLNDELSAYFSFLKEEKAVTFQPKQEAKVARFNFRRVSGIAASLALLISAYFLVNQSVSPSDDVYYAQTPEEALEITKNALSIINKNVNKGNSLIFNNLNEYNKVNLFK